MESLKSSKLPFSFAGIFLKRQRTVESGLQTRGFYRETIKDENGKLHTKTKFFIKNESKVTLGKIGDLQVYVYPYDYPGDVFIGTYPLSTKINSSLLPSFMGAYNKIRWFLRGDWQKETKNRKASIVPRQSLVSAYNHGLKAQIAKENGSSIPNLIRENRPELVYKCPFCEAQIWFNSAIELVRHLKKEKHGKTDINSCKRWVVKIDGKWKVLQ